MSSSETTYDLFTNLVTSHALAAAARSGALERLRTGPVVIAALADQLGLDERALRRVLEVLQAARLVEREGALWRLGEPLQTFDEEMPESLAAICESLGSIDELLSSGEPPVTRRVRSDYENSVDRLWTIFHRPAREVAEELDGELDTVLDLGTGSGVFGIAVAQHHGASLTGVDCAEVLPAFQRRADQAGLDPSPTTVAGDFLEVDLPDDQDCVLICNVLRILPPDDARRLIQRAVESTAADGRVVVVDVIGKDPPEYALKRAVYRLDLAMRNASGGPHPAESLGDWIHESGAVVERRLGLRHAPLAEDMLVLRRE